MLNNVRMIREKFVADDGRYKITELNDATAVHEIIGNFKQGDSKN